MVPEGSIHAAGKGADQVSDEDIKNALSERVYDQTPKRYINLFRRGIGVHHDDLPTELRQGVENLFRTRKLAVVFATATLAVGINMPAKTSIFVGDAVYTNATYVSCPDQVIHIN